MNLDVSLICGPMAVLYVVERDMYDEACRTKKKKREEEAERKAEPGIMLAR